MAYVREVDNMQGDKYNILCLKIETDVSMLIKKFLDVEDPHDPNWTNYNLQVLS